MAATKKATRAKPKAEAKSSAARKVRRSSPAIYTDPALRDRLKAEIQAGDKGGRAGEWSARKSQLLAAEYKKAGGGYKKSKGEKAEPQKSLDEWTDQDWTTRDGKPAVRDGETSRYLPRGAWEKLSPAERKSTDAKKKTASRKGEQLVANTKAAKEARKRATEEQ